MVTFSGLFGHLIAAALAYNNQMTLAGLVLLLFAPLDALDGAMARLKGNSSRFGAFFDSVIDRYSELIIMGGLLGFYIQAQDGVACLAVYAAAAGSILVSYMRARAEGLGMTAKIGLLSRVERYLILIPALIINHPLLAVWVIAVLANFTAIQRVLFVRSEACKLPDSQPKG
jgi:CDP-diacylglycerol--glycerol-3-phosphate 3-phosphatidyltransferase